MNKFHFLALSGLCLLALPVHAQQSNQNQTSVQKPLEVGPSLREHLQLKASQIEDLNALYDDWTTKRSDFSDVRARALQVLTPLQRAQLDSIAKDTRVRIRDDQYSQLLLTPVGDTRVTQNQRDDYRRDDYRRDDYRRDDYRRDDYRRDDYRRDDYRRDDERQRESKNSRNRNRRNNGSGSYGVYGGYGYGGPNYGVYGNYGQGNVGVGATIGRYGPSIGVNVGRVFGGRRLR